MVKDLNKIRIKIQTPYGEKTFIFNMNRHFVGSDNAAMNAIANWIANNADSPSWLQGPLWIILNARITKIKPGHPLWSLLDPASQATNRNYLMWRGHIKFDDTITVTHFGPLGWTQENNLNNDFQRMTKQFWRDMLSNVGISSPTDLDSKSPSEKATKTRDMKSMVDKKYLKMKKEIEEEIERMRSLLQQIIREIFGVLEEGAEVTAMLAKSLAPTAFKLMLREITKIVLKQIAKEIAAIGAKQGGKAALKKIPAVGLFVGAGLGFWRLAQGDPGRAILEVASGAASCAPGAGTAASVGIDASIAAIDIAEAVQMHEARRSLFLERSNSLQQLLDKLEKLDKMYHRIKRAYDEFDFEDDSEEFIEAINYIC